MTDPKTRSRNQPKEKGRPKSDQADKPKGHIGSTDEGEERATGRADRDFDPNVNQRPPR